MPVEGEYNVRRVVMGVDSAHLSSLAAMPRLLATALVRLAGLSVVVRSVDGSVPSCVTEMIASVCVDAGIVMFTLLIPSVPEI